MKKLFISFVFALILGAVFVISASAVKIYPDDGVVYATDGMPDGEVKVEDNRNNNNLPAILIIPETVTYNGKEYKVTSIWGTAFLGNSKIEEVYFPKTIEKIESASSGFIQSCANLRKVVFEKGCPIEEIPNYAFTANPKLEEVVLPDNLKVIHAGAFTKCSQGLPEGTVLTLHLPDTLEQLGTEGRWSNAEGVFTSTFGKVVLDSNIMPKNLKYLYGELFTNSDLVPDGSKTLVFSAEDMVLDGDYMFNTDSYKTIIFLGSIATWDIAQNCKVSAWYFAKQDPASVHAAVADSGKNGTGNVFFCSEGKKCNWEILNHESSKPLANISFSNMGANEHITGATVTHELGCVQDAGTFTYSLCCGKVLSSNITEKARGYHVYVQYATFENGFDKSGLAYKECKDCKDIAEKQVLEAIFTAKGYAVNEIDGSAMVGGFYVCLASLDLYEQANNTTLDYGILFVNADSAKDKKIEFIKMEDADGNPIMGIDTSNGVKAIQAKIVNTKAEAEDGAEAKDTRFDTFNFKITGFDSNESSKTISLVISMYVFNGAELSFVQRTDSAAHTGETIKEATSGSVLKAVTFNSANEAKEELK